MKQKITFEDFIEKDAVTQQKLINLARMIQEDK